MFCSLPEELVARILSLAFPSTAHRHRTAPLLVSRQFFRIAVPLLYHSLNLHSPRQTTRVLATLSCHPALASAVRRVVFGTITYDAAALLALCHNVHDVDISLDGGPLPGSDVDAEVFCDALERRHSITHLTLRKSPAVYLTHPRPMHVLQRLAEAVREWTHLETVHFTFRISSSPSTLPLAWALSAAPRLRTVRAQVPAVWNNLLLVISTNPCLERVMLYAESRPSPAVIKCDDIEHAVLGTGLYMMEARKHARLSELIKSGTSIIRTRATTIATAPSTSSSGGTPLSATRAKELADELMSNRRRTYSQDM